MRERAVMRLTEAVEGRAERGLGIGLARGLGLGDRHGLRRRFGFVDSLRLWLRLG
jgi:hypothetical protein